MTLDELEESGQEVEEDDEWDPEVDLQEAIDLLKETYTVITRAGVELKRLTITTHNRLLKVKTEAAEFLMQFESEEDT